MVEERVKPRTSVIILDNTGDVKSITAACNLLTAVSPFLTGNSVRVNVLNILLNETLVNLCYFLRTVPSLSITQDGVIIKAPTECCNLPNLVSLTYRIMLTEKYLLAALLFCVYFKKSGSTLNLRV